MRAMYAGGVAFIGLLLLTATSFGEANPNVTATSGTRMPMHSTRTRPVETRASTNFNFRVIHSFDGSDGNGPQAALSKINGILYGTTYNGGARNDTACRYSGCGTVFAITPSGTETVLYNFTGRSGDGEKPQAGLVNVNGSLYGTTYYGGTRHCADGCGVVFAITPARTERVIHRFGGSGDGSHPYAGVIDVNGTLYGTTQGGANGPGTVYALTPAGTETILHTFGPSPDGAFPLAGLIDVNGVLYGTTAGGGTSSNCDDGCGTVFAITPAGAETVLHSFGGTGDGKDPYASLVNVNGTLYGTTYFGGAHGAGVVFAIRPSGTETVLHSFGAGGDGAEPAAGLIAVNGRLYGTTWLGGAEGGGAVFAITPSGTETVLYSFGATGDGLFPIGGLVNLNGTLFGTTWGGGAHNLGTVFSLTPTR